jgi:hypothetical protein
MRELQALWIHTCDGAQGECDFHEVCVEQIVSGTYYWREDFPSQIEVLVWNWALEI